MIAHILPCWIEVEVVAAIAEFLPHVWACARAFLLRGDRHP